MSWLEVTAIAPSALAESCSDALEALGALAVSFLEASDIPLLEPTPGTTPLWEDHLKVVGLFEENAPVPLSELSEHFPQLEWSVTKLADQDWTRTWLEYFRPFQLGQRLWIMPTDTVVIKLDPGLAFGTGTHPTTALCLKWLDAHPPIGQEVIDYGCGSGILAIAAILLGAKKVWAVDYDPQALISTRENAKRNGISETQIQTVLPDEVPNIKADTVLANILARPLIELAPKLQALCSGHLVLSGLLTHQADEVKKAYPNVNFEMQTQEDWVCLC